MKMKKEIKAGPNKSENRPINAIWIEESRVEHYAKNYESLKWYQMPKWWIYLWAIFSTLLGMFLFAEESEFPGISLAIIGVGVVFLPFVPFIKRGYVFPFILLMLFKAWDMALTLPDPKMSSTGIISTIMFGIIWMGLCITNIRIELYRYEKLGVKKRFWKDLMIALGIFAVGFAVFILAVLLGAPPPAAAA